MRTENRVYFYQMKGPKHFILLLFVGLLSSFPAPGQNVPFPNGASVQLFDNNGKVCVSCSLYTYIAGGTTPQATYQTAGGTANANPVVMDSAGRANIWLVPGESYRLDLYDASAVLIWSVDSVPEVRCWAHPMYPQTAFLLVLFLADRRSQPVARWWQTISRPMLELLAPIKP